MANTGIKTVLTLRKYVDGVATNETKVNDPSDPDYIAPYEDLVDCPTVASTTATTGTTQSTTATTGTTQSTTATTGTTQSTTETTGTTQSTTETTGTTQSTTATTETTGTTQATTATTASTQATTATTASTQATTATTGTTQSTTATTATTAIPCYEYQASVPTQSGESLEITYIDCDGVEQDILYYWNSGVSSVTFCARSIVGANYPVTGPGAQCGGNQPLPTTQATTATTTLNPTCHEVTYDSSVFSLDQNRYGIAYFDYQGNFTTATFNSMLAETNGSELIYYVCANNVSNDVWDVTNNVAVPQYNGALSSSSQGEPCDGFCSPPGGGGL